MTNWYDYAKLNATKQLQQTRPTFSSYRPSYRPDVGGGYNPYAYSNTSAPMVAVRPKALGASATASAYKPATMPERFDFAIPFPSPTLTGQAQVPQVAKPAPVSTKGDLVASIGGAVGSLFTGGLNLATAVPWFMERTHEYAGALAKSLKTTAVGPALTAVEGGTGVFLDGIQAASDVVGPIIDYLPTKAKEGFQISRAKLYAEMASGRDSDWGPLNIAAQGINLPGAYDTNYNLGAWRMYKNALKQSLDPATRADVVKLMAVLKAQVDISPALKAEIDKDPAGFQSRMDKGNLDEQRAIINKVGADSGMGVQFSYDPGPAGWYANMVYPLAWYTLEYLATRGVATMGRQALVGGVRSSQLAGGYGQAATRANFPVVGVKQVLDAAGYTSAAARLGKGVGVATDLASAAVKLQRYAMASGLGVTAVSGALDAVARYSGNQAAVDWFEQANQAGDFASNPNVMLVTGFTVNPFGAAKDLGRGILWVGGKSGAKVVIGKSLGQKFLAVHDSDTLMDGIAAKMYKQDGVKAGRTFTDIHYQSRGQLFDEILGLAADIHLNSLDKGVRLQFIAKHGQNGKTLSEAVFTEYGEQILDIIKNHGDEIAQRFYDKAWTYHRYPGTFSPEVAAANARDFRLAKGKSYVLRQQIDAITAYTELVPPEGAALARQWLDQAADAAGNVPIRGEGGVQDLIRMLPAMRKYWSGLMIGTEKAVSRDIVEQMIQRSENEFGTVNKSNPTLARTGANPVLRPDSPRLASDLAEALGTEERTAQVILDMEQNFDYAKAPDLVPFLKAKTGLTDEAVAALGPDEIIEQALAYVDQTAKPWRDMGARVARAEKRIEYLRGRQIALTGVERSQRTAVQSDRIAALETQIKKIEKAYPPAQRRSREAREATAPLRAELAALKRSAPEGRRTAAQSEELTSVELELTSLSDLINAASDPLFPFADEVVFTRGAARRATRVREMNPDALTQGDVTFLRDYLVNTNTGRNLSPRDLWEAAKDIADEVPLQSVRHEDMAARALRKVDAQRVLDEISELDTEVDSLTHMTGSIADLAGNFRRVEGNLMWSGGAPAATAGFRRAFGAAGTRMGGRAGLIERDAMTLSDLDFWRMVERNPEVVALLPRRWKMILENLQRERITSGTRFGDTIDLYIPKDYLGKAGEGGTDSWLADASALVGRYHELLAEGEVGITREGRANKAGLARLTRSRDATGIPQVYLDEARLSVYSDAEEILSQREGLENLWRMVDSTGGIADDLVRADARVPVELSKITMSPSGQYSGGKILLPGDILETVVGRPDRVELLRGTIAHEVGHAFGESFGNDASGLPLRDLPDSYSKQGGLERGTYHPENGGVRQQEQESIAMVFNDYVNRPSTLDPVTLAWVESKMTPRWESMVRALRAEPDPTNFIRSGSVTGIADDLARAEGQVPVGTVSIVPAGTTGTWVHYTNRASADSILSGGFRTGESSLGGAVGFPEGTVFVGREGLPFMEYMASEFRLKFPDAEMVKVGVEIPTGTRLLQVGEQAGVRDVWEALHDEAALARYKALVEENPGWFKDKAAAAQLAKELGYDGIQFADEEIALFPRAAIEGIVPDDLLRADTNNAIGLALSALPPKTFTKLWEGGYTSDLPVAEKIAKIKEILFPDGAPQTTMHGPETALDDLIDAHDAAGVAAKSEQYMASADKVSEPVRTTVEKAKLGTGQRPSNTWRETFREWKASTLDAPDPEIMGSPENKAGMEVLSILNQGIIGTTPKTIRRVIDLLHLLESGAATKIGIGIPYQAQAQRVAERLLQSHLNVVKREPFRPGVFEGGLDEAILAMDEWKAARALNVVERGGKAVGRAADGVEIRYDLSDPLGTLQYGFKRRPKDAVVIEWDLVPDLSTEFMAGHYASWSERVWTAKSRQVFNYVFGPLHNTALGGAMRERFAERLAQKGVDGEVAGSIWDNWQKIANESRGVEARINPLTKAYEFLHGDNPRYAGVRNIPNGEMNKWAHEAVETVLGQRGQGMTDPAYQAMLRTINYSDVMREADSLVRRTLYDLPGESLGRSLAKGYGLAVHNRAVTTLYYIFRFGLDIRFHAMNFFEGQILYYGRAGLKKGEIDSGYMGNNEAFLRNADMDGMDNTGYAVGRSRFSWAYRAFLKEQPDALRATIKGLDAGDDKLMKAAHDELLKLAESDPQLDDMLKQFGDTPDAWVREMDLWHSKMLNSVDDLDAGAIIDADIAEHIAETPALQEVYSHLAQKNKELWTDIRGTFFGNPARSRAERMLNSYLLYWPLSYQIKSTKWLMGVMYNRMGGLPTNAGGAVMLSKLTDSHRQLMATDPEYADWFDKHPTLIFVAKMMMPITPDSLGVSLNPIMRNLFFGRTKAFWETGPVFTEKLVRQGTPEIGADLYPILKDVPFADAIFGALSGRSLDDFAP